MASSPAARRIKEAFLGLLEESPNGPITVTQIAQRAHVNRVTFYRLYDSQEAVLVDILDEFDEGIQVFMGGLDISENYEAPVRQMMEHHRANMPMLRTILRSSMAPVLEKRIEGGIRNPVIADASLSSMLMTFYVAGISKVICEWLLGGCVESVDEMIAFLSGSNAMLQPK